MQEKQEEDKDVGSKARPWANFLCRNSATRGSSLHGAGGGQVYASSRRCCLCLSLGCGWTVACESPAKGTPECPKKCSLLLLAAPPRGDFGVCFPGGKLPHRDPAARPCPRYCWWLLCPLSSTLPHSSVLGASAHAPTSLAQTRGFTGIFPSLQELEALGPCPAVLEGLLRVQPGSAGVQGSPGWIPNPEQPGPCWEPAPRGSAEAGNPPVFH